MKITETAERPVVRCYRCGKRFPKDQTIPESCCGAPDCEDEIYVCKPCDETAYPDTY